MTRASKGNQDVTVTQTVIPQHAERALTTINDLADRLFATVPETADITGYDVRTIRKAIEAGEIPAIKWGATSRIPTVWLREQARLGTNGSAGAA